MKYKRFVSAAALLLTLILSACAAPAPIAHQKQAQSPASCAPWTCRATGDLAELSLQEGTAAAERYLASAQDVAEYIHLALLAQESEIDLSDYRIPTDRITQVFTDVMNRYPDLFFVKSGISYTYTSQNYVVTLKPSYRITGKELADARALVDARLDEICAGVDENWSDFEIALYLHDYLCLHFSYDTTYQFFDTYSFLTEGRGVCQAYTLTYIALLERYGIASDVAVSTDMNHIWNVITLGGRAYHVDVTWDDPVPDRAGQALHENFLRSDAGISQTGHYAWVSDYVCDSDAYESTFIVHADAPFVYTAGQWFYADGQARAILAADFSTMRTHSVLQADDKWLTPDGGSYYIDAFFGAGAYRGNLIYNTPKKILATNLQSGVVVEIDAELPRGMQIWGVWVDGDIVYYSVSNTPDGEKQTLLVNIKNLADYLWGDADQNGTVDGRDVTAMLRYLQGLPAVCHTGAADLDDSGAVDARDVEILRQYLVENH